MYSMSSNFNYKTSTAGTFSNGTSATSSSVVVEEVSYEFDMTAVILQWPPELSDFTCPDNNMFVEVLCEREVESVASEECLEQEENEVIEARTAAAAALIVQENNQNVVETEDFVDEEGNEAAAALASDLHKYLVMIATHLLMKRTVVM